MEMNYIFHLISSAGENAVGLDELIGKMLVTLFGCTMEMARNRKHMVAGRTPRKYFTTDTLV
jgi:hypothetical protein